MAAVRGVGSARRRLELGEAGWLGVLGCVAAGAVVVGCAAPPGVASGAVSVPVAAAHPLVLAGAPLRVGVGARHACALGGERIWCWGRNASGEIGDGTQRARPHAVPVSLQPDCEERMEDVGMFAECEEARSTSWWRWPLAGEPSVPREVLWGRPRDLVLAPDTTCVLLDTGRGACWGTSRADPWPRGGQHALLPSPAAAMWALRLGANTGVARTAAGRVAWWLRHGQRLVGVGPPSLGEVVEVATDDQAFCVRTRAGEVRCFVPDWDLEAPRFGGRIVTVLAGAVQLVGSPRELNEGQHVPSQFCALLEGGDVSCWQVRDTASRRLRVSPRDVDGLEDVSQIALGSGFGCARRSDGRVACWGRGRHGELGRGQRVSEQIEAEVVAGLEGVADISAGPSNVCVALSSGRVACWGDNRDGQLGVGRLPHTEVRDPASGVRRCTRGLCFSSVPLEVSVVEVERLD